MLARAAVVVGVLELSTSLSPSSSQEPYPYLYGGQFLSNSSDDFVTVSDSPDPLVNYRWNLSSDPTSGLDNMLQVYDVPPQSASVITGSDSSFSGLDTVNGTSTSVQVTAKDVGMLKIDFGFESAGWFEIDSPNYFLFNSTQSLYLSLSEYNQPWWIPSDTYNKTRIPITLSNNYTLRLVTNSDFYEGTRFGFIILSKKPIVPISIDQIRCVAQIRPTNYVGAFKSNLIQYRDASGAINNISLARIWYTAAFCVKANMLPFQYDASGPISGGMGAILMYRGDREAWVGDNHVSQKVAMLAFGEFYYVLQELMLTMTNSNGGILSYELYWIQSIYDYFLFTNDSDVLQQNFFSQVSTILDAAIDSFGKNPDLKFYGWDDRIGAGFQAAAESTDAQQAYKMLTIDTLFKTSYLYEKAGDSDNAEYLESTANKFIAEVKSESDWLDQFGLHSSADAINGGWLNQTEIDYLFSQHYNNSLLICSFSPFNQFFVLSSMARANVSNITNYILVTIDLCWGQQIKLNGATAFYEVFAPFWPAFQINDPIPNSLNGYTSECHPWSSGVLSFLSQNMLGVTILEPGFGKIRVAPMLSSVKGSIPVPINVVSIRKNLFDTAKIVIDVDAKSGKYFIDIPKAMKIDLHLPIELTDPPRHILMKHMEQKDVYTKDLEFEIVQYYAGKHYIHVKDWLYCSAGRYQFDIGLDQVWHDFGVGTELFESPFPPVWYPCAWLGFDNKTRGDWIGTYGSDGYYLFGFGTKNSSTGDLSKLPAYVTSFKASGEQIGQFVGMDANTSNINALQVPYVNDTSSRALGHIYSSTSMNIDVELNVTETGNQVYNVSVYCFDWDGNGDGEWVRVMDLSTFDIIAETVYVADMGSVGKWMRFQVDRSFRIRVDQMRGIQGTVSAVMFDS